MRLVANNVQLPCTGDIVLKFCNPLFNDKGLLSLPLEFSSRVPQVLKAFGFPSGKEVATLVKMIPGYIEIDNHFIYGSWKVTEADTDVIRTYFVAGLGDFYSKINKMYLPDIDFGGIFYPTDDPLEPYQTLLDLINSKLESIYPDSDYTAYTAYMPNNKGDGYYHFLVNNVSMADGVVNILAPVAGGGSNSVFLFVGAVIEKLFSTLGYFVTENIFKTDPELQRLTIFNTYNIFPNFGSPHFGKAMLDFSKLVPKILCSEFIKAIRNRFNIGFFIDEKNLQVRIIKFDSILKNGPVNTSIKIGKHSLSNNCLSGVNFPLNPPDEFSRHNYPDDSEIYITATVAKYRDILPETRIEGSIIFVTSEQTYYKIVLDEEDIKIAERLCPKQYPYKEGDGSSEIQQISGVLSMYTYSKLYSYYYPEVEPVNYAANIDLLLPRCDLAGNREGDPYTPFPLIFVSARGLQKCWVEGLPGAPELIYPMGSTDLYDALGDQLSTAEMALKWRDPAGIIARYWTNRLLWEQNTKKLVKTDSINPFLDILSDFSKILRIGTDNYFVDKFTLTAGIKVKVVTDVELIRI